MGKADNRENPKRLSSLQDGGKKIITIKIIQQKTEIFLTK